MHFCKLILPSEKGLPGAPKRLKPRSFGGLRPLDPHQGRCPWTPRRDGRALRSLLRFATISFFFLNNQVASLFRVLNPTAILVSREVNFIPGNTYFGCFFSESVDKHDPGEGDYFHQNCTWMCLPDLENLTFSIPIFCLISPPPFSIPFSKGSTQFWPNWCFLQ